MKKIPLRSREGVVGYALVSDKDYPLVSPWKWYINKQTGYACHDRGRKTRIRWTMHRLIMGFPEGAEIDHINGNKLDNRRENLRICSRRTNATNSGKRYPRGEYGRNVTKMKGRKKPYHVQCWNHGKPVSGGYFRTLQEAQAAAEQLRKDLNYVN